MTNEEINIAIAEACGWTLMKETDRYGNRFYKNGNLIARAGIVPTRCDPLPNYCGDLNAMHEAEMSLDYETWCIFYMTLGEVVKEKQHLKWITPYNYISATAAQRAEAFLRTIGKWKE